MSGAGRKRERTAPAVSDYDVLVIGGGPAGLSAASFCGRKLLRTALFEGDCWGGILTRWCPDKRIDDYPGLSPGIRAVELAHSLLEFARRAEVDLVEKRVEEITEDGEVLAGGERFRGKRVVIVGGGDTALSHAKRLSGIASRVTLVHRHKTFRTPNALPEELEREGVEVLLSHSVETILGADSVEGVRLRSATTGEERDLPVDAVVMAVGTKPNSALLRELRVSVDWTGRVVTDQWQRTSVPGIFAIGDVSSHLKMIVTAVAQAATAAHQAYAEVRSPYWK
ncbi:MAG: FAD-dependent oxidoreductase [Deltaproteobacteria bacterium]|nr:FAD-dependent oxidoreductase [Deltaproteobacteria bacterium]